MKHVPDRLLTQWKFRDVREHIKTWLIPHYLMKRDWDFLTLQRVIVWLKGCIPSTLLRQTLNMGNKKESHDLNHILFDPLGKKSDAVTCHEKQDFLPV